MIDNPTSCTPAGAGLIWVSSVADSLTHLVADVDMAAGILAGVGEYAARCGELVIADACTAPAGSSCPLCAELWRRHLRKACASTMLRSAHRHAKRGPSWWSRLVHRAHS